METSQEREVRLQNMTDGSARSLYSDVGNASFDILENIGGPDYWLGDHETDLSITMSVADWARVFTAIQFSASVDFKQGYEKNALDGAYLAMEIAAEMAACKRPVDVPAAVS